jgi:hypothetical protein
VQAKLAYLRHRLRKGADAGQDQAVGRSGALDVVRYLRRNPDVLERLLDRAKVAHPVIEDRDPRFTH